MKFNVFFVQTLLIIIGMTATPAFAETTGELTLSPARPATWFIYGIILFTMVGTLIAILQIRSALTDAKWSLAEALSEQIELTKPVDESDSQPAGNQPVVQVKKLYPSSSRMVALMGTIAILFLFLSFGVFALFHFAQTGKMPEGIDQAVTFLTAGLTLFAPYLVNKISKSFEILSPKP